MTKYKLVIEASVRSLSIEMGQIYSLYRMYYFQLDVFDSRHINECLDSFNKQCEYIFKEYSEGNSSFVFRAIETCFSECFNIIDILKSFAQRNKETALKYQIYALHKTLDSVHNTYHEERKTIEQKAKYLKTDSPVINLKKAN
ncbi:hypothetical protein [Aegicerativicinus sediminis]|uniref:hypothetical protein n=1 Tax=Aegicerativicinus sediminis TaxID=2893202 RepID=UPI001E2BF28F|nr:hypothetical protein [Aegicerativicinus sediminis]